MNKYQCIFCGEKIDEGKVTSILISTNWSENENEQEHQQVFCHLDCLKGVCKNSRDIMVEGN